jgi:hypothetical protein
MRDYHAVFRASISVMGALTLPVSALVCRGFSRMMAAGYDTAFGGRCLPAMTEFVVRGQSRSWSLTIVSAILGMACVVGYHVCSKLDSVNPWKTSGQLLFTVSGPFLALLLFVATIIAGQLPLVSPIITSFPK